MKDEEVIQTLQRLFHECGLNPYGEGHIVIPRIVSMVRQAYNTGVQTGLDLFREYYVKEGKKR